MNNDKFQDKYDEIFQELKEDKMNWDFNDFLNKTEEQRNEESEEKTPIIPIAGKQGKRIPKMFWMAASILLLAGVFFGIKNWNSETVDPSKTNSLVENQIRQQKQEIIAQNTMAFEDTLKTKNFTEDTIRHEVSNPDEIIDRIVPKRGRLKKVTQEKYTQNIQKPNNSSTTSSEYEDNFVIINGHKIKNEQEAINVAEYSFRMLSDKVAQTIASSVVQERPINE